MLDFTGRQVSYTYDAAGNLATVTDAAGNRTTYAYYTDTAFAHLLQTVTKPAGNWTGFEYYVNRQTARISDSAGRNMRFLYLPFSHQTIFIDARGFASSYYYDAARRSHASGEAGRQPTSIRRSPPTRKSPPPRMRTATCRSSPTIRWGT